MLSPEEKYPYYIVPLVEEYRQLDPESPRAKELSRYLRANIGDYASLRLVLGIDPPEFAKFYPDMETTTPGTFDTIDSFLDMYGKDLVPMGYVPEESPAPENLSDLIREKRYGEALELINTQNLNNPQKSIYFAHQMRFIKKLISLQKFKNQQH